MIAAFFFAVAFTLGVSALCSVLEAMILSTRSIEVENLKKSHPRSGVILEKLRKELESTIASILTVNTVANTLGSIIVGALAASVFGTWWVGVVSALMTVGILFFSEILPKNIGVLYRPVLQPFMVFPLLLICRIAGPITNFSTWLIRRMLRRPPETNIEGEIEMIAEREAREGRLSVTQLRLIQAAMELEDATVEDAMTPRGVVLTASDEETAGSLVQRLRKIPFARIPVTGASPDDILGIVRRKDLLHAVVSGRSETPVRNLMRAPVFVPEIGQLATALDLMISGHQQLAIVVDEFGGFSGVITLEDILEFLIGREFYEADDVAVDMQELARHRSRACRKQQPRDYHT